MRHSRRLSAVSAALATMAAVSALWTCAAPAASAAGAASVAAACPSHTAGTTITLTADCTTTVPLTVPDGFTLDGAGFTIFAHDPAGGRFMGAVVGNAGPEMSLRDLTIQGTGFALDFTGPLWGVSFDDASGSMTDVHVLGITQHTTPAVGIAIRIVARSVHRTVTITGSSASDFQRGGLLAAGDATVDVSGSTFGPPDLTVPNPGGVAQNTVQYGSVAPFGGTGGTFTGNTVIGAGFGRPANVSTAMLLWDAAHLTVSHNTFSGAGTDVAIHIVTSTGITIAYNHIARTASPSGFEDAWGIGAWDSDTPSAQVHLICNTFGGWIHNLRDLTQPPCITTTSLPDGTDGHELSATLEATNENPHPDLTWTVVDGFLPPGLTLHAGGTVTGTPTQSGVFTFTVQVHDPVDGVSTREFTITVHGPPPVVSLSVTKTAVPSPGIAGQPITYTITVFNGGPDDAFGVTVDDHLSPLVADFTWSCAARGSFSSCPLVSGSGSIATSAVDVGAGGTVTFTLAGVLPVTSGGGHASNTVRIVPPSGTADRGCAHGCEAAVEVAIAPELPVTGPNLMAGASAGTALAAFGGLILPGR